MIVTKFISIIHIFPHCKNVSRIISHQLRQFDTFIEAITSSLWCDDKSRPIDTHANKAHRSHEKRIGGAIYIYVMKLFIKILDNNTFLNVVLYRGFIPVAKIAKITI